MKEIRDIIKAYDNAVQQGKASALATVVHVDGSSYRRPGARMLVTEDGHLTGAISGGCLEGDALRKALLVIMQKKPMLVTYDTTDEDDAKFGVGLGCNGIIQVLIEPLHVSEIANPITLLKEVISHRQASVLVTFFSLQNKKSAQRGTCLLLKEDGTLITSPETIPLYQLVTKDAAASLSNKETLFRNYISENENLTSFIEFIQPPVALVIIGAGNDVVPLVDIATVLGWDITVVDGRPNYANAERFRSPCRVMVSKPETVLEKIQADDQTAFVLMTHNYNYDLAMLEQLIKKNVRYTGVLGPKKKLERMLSELSDKGVPVKSQQLSAIYGPVGLDIGAETPPEIALSIVAEIKAVLASRQGQSLRNKEDVIHPRTEAAIGQINFSNQP